MSPVQVSIPVALEKITGGLHLSPSGTLEMVCFREKHLMRKCLKGETT